MKIQDGPNDTGIYITIMQGEDDRNIAYGVLVIIYGDKDYPFNEIDKEAMKTTIGEAVESIMLPGQEGVVHTLSIQERKGVADE